MSVMLLGDVCEINPSKKLALSNDTEISFIPMEAISIDGHIDVSRSIPVEKVKNYTVFREGDILFAKITPCMENGKGAIAVGLRNSCGAGSTEFIVLRPNTELVLPKWIYLFLSQKAFRLNCQQNMTGSAGQKRVPAKFLAKCCIPVPSLTEQERIIARIEELFSQLDKGVETLQKTKQQLAVYRQAVLKEAFDRIISDSKMQAIKSVCNDIKVGIVIKPAQYYTDETNGIKAFRSANVREFRINDTDWVYLTKEGHRSNLRSEIHTGDVLIVRSGYPGTACVVSEEYNNCNAVDILIAVPNTDIVTSEYLCAFTNSPYGRKLVAEKKRGVAQAHLNVGGYSKMEIPVPEISVQKQVVRSIEQRLSVYNGISKTIDTALRQAEAMRQSILKLAFEGGI